MWAGHPDRVPPGLCGLATLTGFLQVYPMWAGHPDWVPPGLSHIRGIAKKFWLNRRRSSYVLAKPRRCIYVRGLAKMFWPYKNGYIVGTYIISDCVEHQSRDEKKHIVTKDVVDLLLGDVVSVLKNTHHHKGSGWLASRRGSKYENNNTSSQRMCLAYK